MPARFRRSGLAAVTALLTTVTVLAASCGVGSVEVSGRAKPSGSTLSGDAPAGTTTTDPGGNAGDDGPTTSPGDAASSTTDAPSAPASPTATERSDDAFCAAAAEVGNTGLDQLTHFDPASGDPGDLFRAFTGSRTPVQEAITRMDRTAPPAIATDMHTLATSTAATIQALRSGQDSDQSLRHRLRLLLDAADSPDPEAVSQATSHVATYLGDHCGFTLQGHATD